MCKIYIWLDVFYRNIIYKQCFNVTVKFCAIFFRRQTSELLKIYIRRNIQKTPITMGKKKKWVLRKLTQYKALEDPQPTKAPKRYSNDEHERKHCPNQEATSYKSKLCYMLITLCSVDCRVGRFFFFLNYGQCFKLIPTKRLYLRETSLQLGQCKLD